MKTKKLKKAIVLIAMIATIAIPGNLFSQVAGRPEIITSKITNLHYNATTNRIEFTLKLKGDATSGYITDSPEHGTWGGCNIYWNVVPNAGVTLATNMTVCTVADNTDIDAGDFVVIHTNHPPGGTATPPAGTIPLSAAIIRDSEGEYDLSTTTYKVIGHYSIPVTSGIPNSDFYIEQRCGGGNWGPSTSIWASDRHSNPAAGGWIMADRPRYSLNTACPAQALWIGDVDADWFDADNWVNPLVATNPLPPLEAIPCQDTKVFIPGSGFRGSSLNQDNPIAHFPLLNSSEAICDEIVFFQGGQVGRIDLLNYNKAHVQLNFPADEWTVGVSHNAAPDYYYNFAKGYSSEELSAGQWHMLSMPIKGVVSGDLAYGGYPMTFMRKFNIENKDKLNPEDDRDEDGGRFTEGDWSTSFTEKAEVLEPGEGFAFYIYPRNASTNFGYQYISTDEAVTETGSGFETRDFGLLKTASVMEFPTYDNSVNLKSHRIQKYTSGQSTFYAVNVKKGALEIGDLIKTEQVETRTRSNDDFKLITEGIDDMYAQANGRTVMVGNPYASALDFRQFYNYNRSGNTPRITNAYKIWNGTSFIDYNCATSTASGGEIFTPYIAPMQAFFVTGTRNGGSLIFEPEDMSTVTPKGTPSQLRSTSNVEENIIRISASNPNATTSTVIGQLSDAIVDYKEGEDITKLFSPSASHSYVPEVFTTTQNAILSMNYINNVSANIAVGVRVPASGTTTLKLTGMDNYNADKIELVDGITGETIWNVTGLPSYEHSFNNGDGGYQAGRFYLRIAQSTTGFDNEATDEEAIQIYKTKGGIQVISSPSDLIRQIQIHDIQGRTLYSNNSVNADIYKVTESFDVQVFIIKVVTEKNTKSVKLNN